VAMGQSIPTGLGRSPQGPGGAARAVRSARIPLLLALVLPLVATGARAEEPAGPAPPKASSAEATPSDPSAAEAQPGASAPAVSIDRLFELPSGFEAGAAPRRGGGGETEWRERFAEARARLERAEAELARSKQELAEVAESSNSWSVAPPMGGLPKNTNDAPLSYELSQRIKKQQREVDAARRELLDLEVEANLAGVPEAWRQ